MSLAILLPSLEAGGAERNAINLALGLRRRGVHVEFVLAEARGEYLHLVPDDIAVTNLGARHVALSLPRLVRYLRHEEPETLLAVMDHMSIVALMARKLGGTSTRILASSQTIMSQARFGSVPKREVLIPFLARITYPWADCVITVSHGAAEDLSRMTGLAPKQIRVLYNPVVTPQLFKQMQEPLHHPWFTSGEPPVLLAAGRLAMEKDFSTLLRAFELVRENRAVRLVILGEGPLRPMLEDLVMELGIEADVSLPGYENNPYAYMRHAHVFVLSSAWEGLPTVLIEAMACGTPVVSTDCPGGASEILLNGDYGSLVPVGNARALADSILDTLTAPLRQDLLRSRAMDFHVDKIVNEYLDIVAK